MAWLNIAILVLAGIFIILAVIALVGGWRARVDVTSAAYGVGRQESRRTMQVAFLRGGLFVILALILIGVYGLNVRPEEILSTEAEPAPTERPAFTPTTELPALQDSATEEPATTEPEMTVTATTAGVGPVVATATTASSVPTVAPTATDAPTPTITPTPVPTAIVNSEVGLYLRPEPGSAVEAELLANGTELILLDGLETVDDLEWQRVRTPSGNEGWVAVDFITYQQ